MMCDCYPFRCYWFLRGVIPRSRNPSVASEGIGDSGSEVKSAFFDFDVTKAKKIAARHRSSKAFGPFRPPTEQFRMLFYATRRRQILI